MNPIIKDALQKAVRVQDEEIIHLKIDDRPGSKKPETDISM
jgi:hypothetical protein